MSEMKLMLELTVDASERRGEEHVTLVFRPQRGGQAMLGHDQSPIMYAIPLEQDDATIAKVTRGLATFAADLVMEEMAKRHAVIKKAKAKGK